MTAVLTLPFDIIYQVFVYCLPPEADVLPWRREAPLPLLLAGVCREWREAALATHELWNTMHLYLFAHTILKVGPLLDFWIPRAGNLPLSMSLIFNMEDNSSGSGAGVDALDSLIAHYARHWTSIRLRMPIPALRRLNSSMVEFSCLTKVVLYCGLWVPLDDAQAPVAAFSNSPKLRELHVLSKPVSQFVFPWDRLATLRLETTTVGDCLRTLARVPSLVDFTTRLWDWDESVPTHVSLPRLESLTLPQSHTRGPELLHFLTLPALQRLGLDLEGQRQIRHCTSFVTRSSCSLRRLSVRLGPLWTRGDFVRLFVALDSLEGLEVRQATRSLDAGSELLKDEARMLPNLMSLNIKRTMPEEEDAALLADLLESRWNIPAGTSLPVRLKFFKLSSPLAPPFTDVKGGEAVHRLARLRVAGMDLQITSSDRIGRVLVFGRR
ncbi:hypothetical protein C8F04DRAFT_1001635 [Mycena alexandri]|uniref:F-box domain-containing protein n=1 Tax=Mycena alexandri TaxID=1745969 RepID=A0AAD6X2Z5_9AGAR|nr:hypothetical protein C8F04DRAFT_1001635 [Mycena alexandri]